VVIMNEAESSGHQPGASTDATPAAVARYRRRLSRGENVVDPETWAGSLPAAHGIAPRVRVGRSRWFNLLWLMPIGWGC
jgi:sulfoxide reductase catalytic subunit YedY